MVFLGRPATAPDHLLLRDSLLLRLAHQLLHCPTALLRNLDTVHLEGSGTLLSGHSLAILKLKSSSIQVRIISPLLPDLHVLTLLHRNTRTLRLGRTIALGGAIDRLGFSALLLIGCAALLHPATLFLNKATSNSPRGSGGAK